VAVDRNLSDKLLHTDIHEELEKREELLFLDQVLFPCLNYGLQHILIPIEEDDGVLPT
jgi:hypothetical protein